MSAPESTADRRRGSLVLQQMLVVGVAILVWRFGGWMAGTVVGVGLVGGHLWAHRQGRGLPGCVVGVLAGAVLVSGLIPGAWDCDIACAEGSHYRDLLGVPSLLWALGGWIAYLVAYGLRRMQLAGWIGALLVGGHLYFASVAVRLEVPCDLCGAAHTVGLLLLPHLPWPAAVTGILAGAGVLHLAFHPQLVSDRGLPAGPSGSDSSAFLDRDDESGQTIDPLVAQRVDRGRRYGSPQAPWTVEILVSTECPHCAAVLGPLLAELHRRTDDRRLHIVVRHTFRQHDAASRDRVRLLLAAGLEGQHARALLALLDAERLQRADNRQRLQEHLDPALLDRHLERHGSAIDAVAAIDQQRARAALAGTTPVVRMSHRDGEAWTAAAVDDVAAIMARIDTALANADGDADGP